MGYAEDYVTISMFSASVTIVCSCMIKRLLCQDTQVVRIFEKYIHSHNLDVLVLYIFNFQVIFIMYLSLRGLCNYFVMIYFHGGREKSLCSELERFLPCPTDL